MNAQVKLLFADRAFYATPPKRIKVEENPGTGRIYFIADKRIVAVAAAEKVNASA